MILVLAGGFILTRPSGPGILPSSEEGFNGKPAPFPEPTQKEISETCKGVCLEKVMKLSEKNRYISVMALNPEGKQLAVGGGLHRLINIWNIEQEKEIKVLDQPGQPTSLTYSPDGRFLASGRGFTRSIQDKININIWDAKSWNLLQNWRGTFATDGSENNVRSLAFSPDSKRLAVAVDGLIKEGINIVIRDMNNSNVIRTLSPNEFGGVDAITYSPDGKYLAAGGSRGIEIWDPNTGNLVKKIAVYVTGGDKSYRFISLVYDPDGKYLATAVDIGAIKPGTQVIKGVDEPIEIWDTSNWMLVRKMTKHAGDTRSLIYHPSGKYLVSTHADRTIKVWKSETGELVEELIFSDEKSQYPERVAFTHDGKKLVVAGGRFIKVYRFNLQ